MSALDKSQKRELAMLATRALALRPRSLGDASAVKSPTAELTAWRHAEVAKACGKLGLRCCTQLDYCAVLAHFLHLLGQDGAAFHQHMRAASEPRRQAEWKLREACRKWGLSSNYAEAICRRQFRCNLAEATEKQLWSLKFTLDKRGRAKFNPRPRERERVAQPGEGAPARELNHPKITAADRAEILRTFPKIPHEQNN